MNAESFIQEFQSSQDTPQSFSAIYEAFQGYQRFVLGALKELHRICEKNGIPYQLAYGSLLGAVRDRGQIPWDYDIDVFVPFCEKDRLIKALQNELDPDFYIMCPEVDPKCRHYFMRIAPKGYSSDILHVDVFYVIGAPDEEPSKFGKRILDLVRIRFIKRIHVNLEAHHNPKLAVRRMLQRVKYAFKPLRKIDDAFYSLCSQYDVRTAKNQLALDEWLDRQVLDPKIWDTVLLDTDVGTFRVASCYDELLTSMYGDYRKLAPLKDRVQEVLRSYQKIEFYNKHI